MSWLSVPCELVSSEYNRVLLVGEHVLNLFSETALRYLHCHSGKLIKPFFAPPCACYRTATGDIEGEIFGAWFEVTLHVAASKRCVRLSDGPIQVSVP